MSLLPRLLRFVRCARQVITMSCLDRLPNETDVEYHRRLLYGKLIDKSIDLDYAELSPYLYGKKYAEDVARRMAYGSVRTLKLLEDEKVQQKLSEADRDVIDELERQQLELAKERQRFYDQRREYKKLAVQDARVEHLFSTLERAAAELGDTLGTVFDQSRVMKLVEEDEEYTEGVLVLSDWHYGMVCDNTFNTFNAEICIRRVQDVIEQAMKRCRLHNVQKLHVVVLGDLIHGAIHTSARVASEELACEQLMKASEILAQAIEVLYTVVPEIEVHMTYGNHARTVQIKADSIHRDNMERLVPWWLGQRLAIYDGIRIVGDETQTEFLLVESCGHEFVAAHGDLDNVRSAARLLPLLFSKTSGRNIEYVLLGDRHHRESFNELGVTSMICGALCGADDYANEHRLYSSPEQLLLITNEKDGVDAEYHLRCR